MKKGTVLDFLADVMEAGLYAGFWATAKITLWDKFGLDESLITPASVTAGGLAATRSPRLTLRTEKLAAALGEPPPTLASGLEEMHRLYLEGYPDKLRKMALGTSD